MRRSFRNGRLVIVAGIAVFLGSPPSPVRAQSRKVGPEAGPGGKSSAEGKSLPQVSILNLQIVKPDPGLADMPAHMRQVRRFGFPSAAQEGTTLALSIDAPQQLILSLETKDCKISKFRDDRDTDLAQAKGPAEGDGLRVNLQRGPENCTLSGEVDPAGHRATVTVHSPHLPAVGANRLSLEADLVMRFGHGEKTVEQKGVNLKVDTIKVGPSPLVVMTQEPVDGMGQDNGMQVLLFHQGAIQREIKKIAFIGPDGAEIPMRGNGSGQSGSVHHVSYALTQKVETCTVRLTVPERIETVTLSVAIDTGVGFPPGARRRTLRTTESGAKIPGSGDTIPDPAAYQVPRISRPDQ
jgi:hypothetical protein